MISIVVPVYNERESLEQLHAEIAAVGQRDRVEVAVVIRSDDRRPAVREALAMPHRQAEPEHDDRLGDQHDEQHPQELSHQ